MKFPVGAIEPPPVMPEPDQRKMMDNLAADQPDPGSVIVTFVGVVDRCRVDWPPRDPERGTLRSLISLAPRIALADYSAPASRSEVPPPAEPRAPSAA